MGFNSFLRNPKQNKCLQYHYTRDFEKNKRKSKICSTLFSNFTSTIYGDKFYCYTIFAKRRRSIGDNQQSKPLALHLYRTIVPLTDRLRNIAGCHLWTPPSLAVKTPVRRVSGCRFLGVPTPVRWFPPVGVPGIAFCKKQPKTPYWHWQSGYAHSLKRRQPAGIRRLP